MSGRRRLGASHFVGTRDGVRPALQILNPESSNLNPGDQLEVVGHGWTVLNGGLALCNEIIGRTQFRKDWEAPDANVYERSDVKRYVEEWAKENGIEFAVGERND